MSGGSGGPIIIKKKLREAAETSAVRDELGPRRLAKLDAVLAKSDGDWSHSETKFVGRCIMDAYEAYE